MREKEPTKVKMKALDQGWAAIFFCGPHCIIICVSWAKGYYKAKIFLFVGRTWPAGRMLPPPALDPQKSFCLAKNPKKCLLPMKALIGP